MSSGYTKLVDTALTGALLLGLVGGAIPFGVLAQTTSATVNFAGKVTAVNVSANSISVEVRWLYGVAANQQSVLPVAGSVCPGKIMTVLVPSTARLIDFSGRPITLAQVQTGAYFNATTNWQNGVMTAQVVRFQRTPSLPPTLPPGLGLGATFAPPAVATSPPPPSTTSATVINIAGKVTAVNPATSSLSVEIRWFYGGYAAQNILFPIAGQLCPGKIVTIIVPSTVKLIDVSGRPITLSQVKVGVYMNATVLWQNGLLTAQVIRFQNNPPPPPKQPASPPPATGGPSPATAPPSGQAPSVAPPGTPPAQPSVSDTQTQSSTAAKCSFWYRLFRLGSC